MFICKKKRKKRYTSYLWNLEKYLENWERGCGAYDLSCALRYHLGLNWDTWSPCTVSWDSSPHSCRQPIDPSKPQWQVHMHSVFFKDEIGRQQPFTALINQYPLSSPGSVDSLWQGTETLLSISPDHSFLSAAISFSLALVSLQSFFPCSGQDGGN